MTEAERAALVEKMARAAYEVRYRLWRTVTDENWADPDFDWQDKDEVRKEITAALSAYEAHMAEHGIVSRVQLLEDALNTGRALVNDLMAVHVAPDMCEVDEVSKATARLNEYGTLWAIAEWQVSASDALAAATAQNEPPFEGVEVEDYER